MPATVTPRVTFYSTFMSTQSTPWAWDNIHFGTGTGWDTSAFLPSPLIFPFCRSGERPCQYSSLRFPFRSRYLLMCYMWKWGLVQGECSESRFLLTPCGSTVWILCSVSSRSSVCGHKRCFRGTADGAAVWCFSTRDRIHVHIGRPDPFLVWEVLRQKVPCIVKSVFVGFVDVIGDRCFYRLNGHFCHYDRGWASFHVFRSFFFFFFEFEEHS